MSVKKRVEKLESTLNRDAHHRFGLVLPGDSEGKYCAKSDTEERVCGSLEEARAFLQTQGCKRIIVVEYVSAKQ
jgi:hypothetical protein